MNREFWPRVDHLKNRAERRKMIEAAVELGFTTIVVSDEGDTAAAKFRAVTIRDGKVLIDGAERGRLLEIRGPGDMPSLPSTSGYLVVRCRDWKVIPLENLIAMHQGTECRLIAETESEGEAELFLGTLEKGVDGLMFPVEKMEKFSQLLHSAGTVQLVEAEIKEVSHAGMGDRACIDTCSIFNPGEGLLVGSQSSSLFLIHAENLEGRYVNPRPFRVNAGPVHSYVLLPDLSTAYLSELKAGMRVLAVDVEGRTRAMTVGRVKIEHRPLMLVVAEFGGEEHSLLLQNAETVNLCTRKGAVAVTALTPGERVLMRKEEGGRHFGMRVKEAVREV